MQQHLYSDTLLELIESIGAIPDPSLLDHALDHILDSISSLMGSSRSFLYIQDSRLPSSRLILKELQPDVAVDIEEYCANAIDHVGAILELPVLSGGVRIDLSATAAQEDTGNINVFPLHAGDCCIGLIGLTVVSDNSLPSFFDRLLRTISCTLDSYFDRLKKEQELSNLNKYLTVSSMLAQSMDLHDLLDITLNCCMESVSAEAASILLLDDEKKNFYFYEIEGPAKPVLMTKTFPSDKGIAASVLQSQRSEIINDVQSDPRFFGKIDNESGFRTKNMLAVPLMAGDEKIGVLEVLNKHKGEPFTDEEHLFLQMIAEEVAFAIRNARIFDYVVNSYCKQRQGLASCKGCKRPLGSWTPCVKYQNLPDSGI